MSSSIPDPIFAAIGEYQARQAVACHAQCAMADAAQARAEAALLSTRATTPDGLHAGMCFRIEAVAHHLQETEHDAAELMWLVLGWAAARKPVATALRAMAAILGPSFFTNLLRAALQDALELEDGGELDARELCDTRHPVWATA